MRHKRHHIFMTVRSRPKPRRLVPLSFIAHTSGILLHFCLSAGSSWLCPICVLFPLSSTCLLVSPVIRYCNLSSSLLFFFWASCPTCTLPPSGSLWFSCPTFLQHLSPDLAYEHSFRHTGVCINKYIYIYISIFVYLCPLLGPLCLCALLKASVSDWISVPSRPLCLLIKSRWSRRSDRRKRIPQCILAR